MRDDCTVMSVCLCVPSGETQTDPPIHPRSRNPVWEKERGGYWLPTVLRMLKICSEVTLITQCAASVHTCIQPSAHIHTCIHLGSVHCVTGEGANAPLTTQHHCLHYYIPTTTPTTSRLDIPPHYLRACRPFQLRSVHRYNCIFAIITLKHRN